MHQSVEIALAEIANQQEEIQDLMAHATPNAQLHCVTTPSNILQPGQIVRVYFEGKGARVIADKVILSVGLASNYPVACGINEDPMVVPGNYTSGLFLYGNPSMFGYPVNPAFTIDAPVEFLSFVTISTNAGNVGINAAVQNPAIDHGYIRTYAWGSVRDSLMLRGNR